jgi:protein-disulfide isomerase
MGPFRRLLPALLLTALLPNSGWAEMTSEEREEFRTEVREYLLENPELLEEMLAVLEERRRAEAVESDRILVAAHGARIAEDGFSYVGGNPEGDVTLVAFMDYQCGYCRRAHPELAELIAGDGGVRWVVKELPILGPGSELAARAAVATLIIEGEEVYAALHDGLLRLEGPINEASLHAALTAAGADPEAVRAAMDDPEVTRRLVETRALAEDLGIDGTPSFVIGERMLRGYVPGDAMRAMVAELRAAD